MKYALITGASSGIGYAMALALAKGGYKVFATSPAKSLFLMKPLQEQGIITIELDVADLDSIKAAVESVKKVTSQLDILYNNAGIARGGPAIDMDEEDVNAMFQVNVIGQMNVTKHFSDLVIAGRGTIVFTSSVASLVPLSWASTYCATKAAIDMYAKSLRPEMAPFGVKVYSVITGGVDTAICDEMRSAKLYGSKYDVDGFYDSAYEAANMSRNPKTTEDPDIYAEGIAKKITKKRDQGFNLYKGGKAYTLYLLSLFSPLWFVYLAIQIHFKQFRVFKNLKKVYKRKQE